MLNPELQSKNMNDVYQVFKSLLNKPVEEGCYAADSIPFACQHKIGISPEGYPMFFIQTLGKEKALDITMEFIKVMFNRSCSIIENNEIRRTHEYTIVSLNAGNVDYQKYFIDVVCILLHGLSDNVTIKTLKIELMKIADLFSNLSKPSKKTLQGLWAELLVIERSKSPAYLLQSWHVSPNDKFDFNDGIDKIEVKSTRNVRRIHTFSLEQLHPNVNANLLIASVFVIETGHGRTIFDLKNSICKKVSDLKLQYRLNEIIVQTLGRDFDKVNDVSFDYQQALDTIAFYDYQDIPSIAIENIPKSLSNIHFDCDLSTVKTIQDKCLEINESSLFKSIQI